MIKVIIIMVIQRPSSLLHEMLSLIVLLIFYFHESFILSWVYGSKVWEIVWGLFIKKTLKMLRNDALLSI